MSRSTHLSVGVAVAVVVAVGVVGCGSSPEHTAAPPSETAGPTISGTFSVNRHDLYLECTGDGSPTMVLEVGDSRTRQDLVKIQDAYDDRLRVCSYDRANKGQSGTASTPREGADIIGDLHDLLAVAEVPGPYLLVGHSAGGLIVEAYAASHPDQVVGVVAINPVVPWKPWIPVMNRMPPDQRRDEVAFMTGRQFEKLDYRDLSRALDAGLPRSVPSFVLVSSPVECPPDNASCPGMIRQYDVIMRRLAHQWGSGFDLVDASHDIQFDDLDAVTHAIDDVLARVG